MCLSTCLFLFECIMSLHTHIFTSRHSQFISLSLWQHHGGCCSLPLGEVTVRWCAGGVWLGSVRRVRVRSLSDVLPSVTRRWRKECHAEGGELEIQLSINCQDEAPQVFTGPDLAHWSVVPITWWGDRSRSRKYRTSDAIELPVQLGFKTTY